MTRHVKTLTSQAFPSGRRRTSRRSRAWRDREGGYSVVEFVIIVPVIMALTLLVVQVGLLLLARHVAQAAAREGVQVARDYQGSDTNARHQTRLYLDTTAPILLNDPRVDLTRTPTTITVRVRAHVLAPLPGLAWGIDEQASGPVERFVTQSAATALSRNTPPLSARPEHA
jgi:TadE-like protein